MVYTSYSIPISVKGIVFEDEKVWLRKNQRGEWELPGGKLDKGEQPQETLIRELSEELGLHTEVVDILQAYLFHVDGSIDEENGVMIITYLCRVLEKHGDFERDGEGGKAEFIAFTLSEINELNMPSFYKDAITKAKGVGDVTA